MTATLLKAWDLAIEKLDPTPDPYANDPVGWTERKRETPTWSKQREVMEAVRDHRHVNVRAAHGTGKSWTAANLVAWWIDAHPVGEAFAVTSAPTSAQVDAILWREIGRAHSERTNPLQGHIAHGGYPKWMVGSEMVAYGRKPTDYANKTQAMQAFQGIHAKYVLVILDEACGIPKWLWDATETLVTNEFSRVLAIGNPDDPATEFNNVARPGSGWHSIKISAFDLPWATGEDVPEELSNVLTGETWVLERERRWGIGSPLYTSKVMGEFPDVSDDTLISPALVREAHERVLDGLDRGRYGADIARRGKGETVVYRNRGGVVRLVFRASKQDTMRTTGDLAAIIRKTPGIPFIMDMIGLGVGVYDRLREQGLDTVQGFDANGTPLDPTRFINRRAEAFWDLREQMEEELIDLDPGDEELASQLQTIKWKRDSRGRIGIESKEDMEKRGLPSPDRADALMYSTVSPHTILDLDDDFRIEGITDDLMGRPM